MRLVVTGENAEGRSVVAYDGGVAETELCGPRVQACFLWGRDDIARLPEPGERPALTEFMPPPGGCRFSTLSIAPGASGDYHSFIVRALGELAEPHSPGFHKTPTIDFIYVISGTFTLELDSNQQRILLEGESAVLHGNRHRWHNSSDTTAKLLAVSVGAMPATTSEAI